MHFARKGRTKGGFPLSQNHTFPSELNGNRWLRHKPAITPQQANALLSVVQYW